MKLRTNLFALVICAILPLLAVAVISGVVIVQHERDSVQREAIGRARSAMSAVDAELRGSLTTTLALAASEHLQSGDIRAFHEEARRVLANQPEWLNIGLATVSRTQLMDAVRPWGEHAAFSGDDDAFDRAVQTGKPAIGNVRAGAAITQSSVRIRLPIVQDGSVRYVLSVPIKPSSFEELLRAQQIPEGWVIVIADRERKFIARIPPAPVGHPVSESFNAAIDRAPEGFFSGLTVEGLKTYTPYVTSPLSGWVLGVAIPAAIVEAGARRAFFIIAGGLLAALAAGLGLAWFMSRRISGPIASLAGATETFGAATAARAPERQPIDEIARLDEALRDAFRTAAERQEKLEEADRRKDEFLAALAHELRNPLAPIVSALQLLQRPELDAAAHRKARAIIERQIHQMVRLIDDLLDVSRVSRGKLALRREPVALESAIDQVLEACQPSIAALGHELTVTRPPSAVWLHADPVRLVEILVNLLGNACKFTPRGGKIALRFAVEGAVLVASVADDGIGIEPELLPRVFDLFTQANPSLERTQGGLGIGLTLVKQLVELHGGSVLASSDGAGKGSEFVLRLPIVIDAPQQRPAAVASGVTTRPRRILIADDNRDAADTLAALLELQGHQVKTVYDGLDALKEAGAGQPEVALLDIAMPRMNGYDLARRIREASWGRDATLIALTGWGQDGDHRRSRDAGFDAHLVKPVDVEALTALLNAVPQAR